MTTIDNIMELVWEYAEAYAEAYSDSGLKNRYALADKAQSNLRTALTEALAFQQDWADFNNGRECCRIEATEVLAKDASLINEGNKAQPVREPLTDDVIFEIACGAADEMWPDVGGVGWTKDDAKFYGIFCKKIERAHGIGGDK